LVEDLARECRCAVHAYVLMTNHVHLLVTPEAPENVSNLMKHVGQRYAQYVNRKHRRTGSLWEGRFRSSIVDSERYLLVCQRYIELNPVRAGMVRNPVAYPWSSYRANALGEPSTLIVPHPTFLALGEEDEARRARYRGLVSSGVGADDLEAIRTAAKGGHALGDDAFIAEMARVFGRPAAPRPAGRPRKKEAGQAALF
jgi:putative transposase